MGFPYIAFIRAFRTVYIRTTTITRNTPNDWRIDIAKDGHFAQKYPDTAV